MLTPCEIDKLNKGKAKTKAKIKILKVKCIGTDNLTSTLMKLVVICFFLLFFFFIFGLTRLVNFIFENRNTRGVIKWLFCLTSLQIVKSLMPNLSFF